MTAPTSPDWCRLLWDLIQRGHSVADVAKLAGIAESTLKGYLRGSHPPFWRGQVLITLWCETCGKPLADLPMMEVYIAPRVVNRDRGPSADSDSMRELERAWR